MAAQVKTWVLLEIMNKKHSFTIIYLRNYGSDFYDIFRMHFFYNILPYLLLESGFGVVNLEAFLRHKPTPQSLHQNEIYFLFPIVLQQTGHLFVGLVSQTEVSFLQSVLLSVYQALVSWMVFRDERVLKSSHLLQIILYYLKSKIQMV
jgi:hypothetical protein